MEITDITFEHAVFLWFLIFIPILIAAYAYNLKLKKKEALLFSNFETLEHVIGPTFIPSYFIQIALRILIFLLLVFAAAGMSIWYTGESSETDVVILIDTSASMSANDTNLTRLEIAKETATSIIDNFPEETKASVISFAGTPLIKQKLTGEKSSLKESISKIKLNTAGGTDVSAALITAANTLSISEREKAIILLTDGSSTVGTPIKDGVEYVKNQHITVHTIGIGTEKGGSLLDLPGDDAIFDEGTLKYIAISTYGTYLRITKPEETKISYREQLKTNLSKVSFEFTPSLLAAVILLIGLEWILSFTKYSRVP